MTSMINLEIHEAASHGDFDALEEFIRSGKFDVNQGDVDFGDKTPLHWACQKGFAECVRLLRQWRQWKSADRDWLDSGPFRSRIWKNNCSPSTSHGKRQGGQERQLRLHSQTTGRNLQSPRLCQVFSKQEIAERRRALGLLNSSDEEDEVETVTSVAFAVEEKSSDDTIRSSSRQRRRKDAVVSPTQSEGRKSRGSDISALSKLFSKRHKLSHVYTQSCSYSETIADMYTYSRSNSETIADMDTHSCSCSETIADMDTQSCSCSETIADMDTQSCSCSETIADMYTQSCSCSETIADMYTTAVLIARQ
ncbi:hypothetical protein Btru_041675 [Bulinus truncatus]|nr:hypothetical protein Btru_041675 [Bulinus truncatus]